MKTRRTNGVKRILIISALDVWSLGENTGAQSLWKTLEGYKKNKWDVYFVTGNGEGKTKVEDNPFLTDLKITRFGVPLLDKFFNVRSLDFLARNLWLVFFLILSLYKGILITKKEGIEVFYGYEVHGALTAKILSLIFKKPLVTKFQGTLLSKYLDNEGQLWKIKYWWHILAFKIKTDLLVMTNDGTKGDKVLKSLKVNMTRVKFWLNGIDGFSSDQNKNVEDLRSALNILPSEKILLSVSRLEKWKRVDRTIESMPYVVKEKTGVKYIVVGDGSEIRTLKKLTNDLKMEKNVIFVGGVSHSKLGAYYNLADVFVSMYDISNVGNPLLEAMKIGKCVVAYDVGATKEFITHEKTGVLIKDPTPQNLSKVLIELLDNDNKRETLAHNGQKFANERFWSWEERVQAEIEEVEKILA